MTVRVDVDSSTAVAWRAFEHRLAAELVELPIGCSVELGLPIGRSGPSPLVLRFKARPATFLMTAMHGLPARAGARPRSIPPAGVPPVKVFRRDTEADVARWTTRLVRDAYGVIHPAFLTLVRAEADGVREPRPGVVSAATGVPRRRAVSDVEPETDAQSADELDALVVETLEEALGGPIERDRDGDLPIVGEHGVVYVRVLQDRPVIEAFAILQLIDVDALAVTHDAVNQWNSLSKVETYFVEGEQLRVRVGVLGRRFRRSSVMTAVGEVMRAMAEYAALMAEHQSGEDEPAAGDDAESAAANATAGESTSAGRPTTEALTIMQLEAAEPGSVTPKLAARIYGYDRELLLADIRNAEVEVIEWQSSVRRARRRDEEEAAACKAELAACQRTVDLLRAALRVTVKR